MGILAYFFTIMQKIKVLPIEYYRILYVDLLTCHTVVVNTKQIPKEQHTGRVLKTVA